MIGLLYRWHRRFGLWLLLPLLIFSLSGLLHPVMRLVRVAPAHMVYSAPQWPDAVPPLTREVRDHLPASMTNLRLVKVEDQWLLQSWQDRQQAAQFFDPHTGIEQTPAAKQYAIQLARYFSGDYRSAVRDVQRMTQFDQHYQPIDRLLPIWRVRFDRDDVLDVYVDIRNDRLATISDQTRRQLLQWFSWLHSASFLDETDARHGVFIALMVASTLLAMSGVWLFIILPLRQRQYGLLKQVHRWGGFLASVALLMFVISGGVRTYEKTQPDKRGLTLDHTVDLQQILIDLATLQKRYGPLKDARLQSLDGQPVWQIIRRKQSDQWVSAVSGELIPNGSQQFAVAMVQALLPEHSLPSGFQQVIHYKAVADYGFIDKRLPVLGVQYGSETVYVDIKDRVIAKHTNEENRRFSWIFRSLHKWRFADGLGLNTRDGLMALCIVLINIISLIGVLIWLTKRQKRRRNAAN